MTFGSMEKNVFQYVSITHDITDGELHHELDESKTNQVSEMNQLDSIGAS